SAVIEPVAWTVPVRCPSGRNGFVLSMMPLGGNLHHVKEMQYNAKPDKPDPIYARRLQEILGGKFGEMTVMMSYLFQGWNSRGPAKYKDMLLDIGTEEIAHVEMLSVMISRLLDDAPVNAQEAAVEANPVLAAAMGGTSTQEADVDGRNAQHQVVTGGWAAR